MKIKTYRFAAAVAVLLALCLVFMAPVGAAEDEAVDAENGASVKVDGHVASLDNGTVTYYTTPQAAIDAAQAGDEVFIFGGDYTTNLNVNKPITVTGEIYDDGYLATAIFGKVSITADGATVKGLYVYDDDTAVYINAKDVLIEGCELVGSGWAGLYQSYTTGTVTFKDSKIVGSAYAIHFDGSEGGNIVIENCMIQGWTSFASTINKVTISDSEFSNEAYYKLLRFYQDAEVTNTVFPAGMRIDTGNGGVGMEDIEVKFNGCSMEDDSDFMEVFPADVITKSDVYVDDVRIYVAKIGTNYYSTLEDAITNANDGDTIILGKDADGAGIIIDSGKNVVIDFNGYTYTVTADPAGSEGTKTQAFQLLRDSTITMKNGAIVGDNESVKMLIQNYADLTLENMVLDATKGNNNVGYVLSNNNGDVVITGNTQILAKDGGCAFDVYYWPAGSYSEGVSVTVAEGMTGTISGNIEYACDSSDAAKANCTAKATIVIKAGTFNGNIGTEITDANIKIYGGTFSSNPSAYIASGYEVVQPGNSYLVQKYVDRSSSSSSKPVEEPEEPEQPEEPVVEPETPAAPGEATVETEVTDGGEVEFEAPVEEPGVEGGSAAADEDEAKITGVVLPTGTDSEVAFVPVSEQPAPAGQEENTKKVFEINVPTYEKGKPATIKFTMTVAELEADGKEAADVALWHFDEETGEWTKLVTSYTIVDGVVYFEAITNDFSPFAIIYEDEPVDEPVEEPETPASPASPAPVLGLLAALGAAVVLRRK